MAAMPFNTLHKRARAGVFEVIAATWSAWPIAEIERVHC